ncbi:hypothetical protein ACFE04_026687 [Oxalis oulophora]
MVVAVVIYSAVVVAVVIYSGVAAATCPSPPLQPVSNHAKGTTNLVVWHGWARALLGTAGHCWARLGTARALLGTAGQSQRQFDVGWARALLGRERQWMCG